MQVSSPTSSMNPDRDLVALLRHVDDGDEAALRELFGLVEPELMSIAARLSILTRKKLTKPDDLAQVRMYALVRLHRSRGTSLRRFLTRDEQPRRAEDFWKWLKKLVRYAARDHLRAVYGRRPAVSSQVNGKLQPSKLDISRPSKDPEAAIQSVVRSFVGITTHLVVAEITAYIMATFSPTEIKALELYFNDTSPEEIAARLELATPKDAARMVHALKERLRTRFRNWE